MVAQEGDSAVANTLRAVEFWRRSGGIYLGYKVAQAKAKFMSLRGESEESIQATHWSPHHEQAGRDMYKLCVDLRGFFLKAGQFLGSRHDFVPKEMCLQLCQLHDQVPPMPARDVEALIKAEFCVHSVKELFDWIDLDTPLGSASIAQVHKARLRQPYRPPSAPLLQRVVTAPFRLIRRVAAGLVGEPEVQRHVQRHVVRAGQTAWSIANDHGVGLAALRQANPGLDISNVAEGQFLMLPVELDASLGDTWEERRQRSIAAVEAAAATSDDHPDGVVAVKVQYPSSLPLMQQDLGNLRGLAAFLSRTELPFDLASAVDELNKQIRLEFDFTREARVMDTIADSLRDIRERVIVPTSVPGLVTERAIVMSFVDGAPLNSLASKLEGYSEFQRREASKRILTRTSEAYGRMILGTGLFQADGHPGNILVMRGGRIALLDYGQSKQLTDEQRLQVANLVIALAKGDEESISQRLLDMGITTSVNDARIRAQMGVGMFDTRGRVDPFDKDSPIKKAAIEKFPSEMFFVLRVVQLLRGMAAGMDVEFSSADQWLPWAQAAVRGAPVGPAPPVVPVMEVQERKGKYYGI